MYRASVSNIDCFRQWEQDDELSTGWLLQRILGPFEQTPAMRAGEVFHRALENFSGSDSGDVLKSDGYSFEIDCDIELICPDAKEMSIAKEYGCLLVSGRIDAIFGATVYDHKTTAQFDPDRLMSGVQWRFYLDILDLPRFVWNVFVMKEEEPFRYIITDFHTLEQKRYPELRQDCERLARRYLKFAEQYLPTKQLA